MKVELTNGEIDSFADDIYKVLRNVPLFYIHEIIELGLEGRQKDGEIENLDVSDSDIEDDDESESDIEDDIEHNDDCTSENED